MFSLYSLSFFLNEFVNLTIFSSSSSSFPLNETIRIELMKHKREKIKTFFVSHVSPLGWALSLASVKELNLINYWQRESERNMNVLLIGERERETIPMCIHRHCDVFIHASFHTHKYRHTTHDTKIPCLPFSLLSAFYASAFWSEFLNSLRPISSRHVKMRNGGETLLICIVKEEE